MVMQIKLFVVLLSYEYDLMIYRKKALLSDQISTFNFLVGQSHDVWRSYSFFAARVASFARVQMMLLRGTQINYMRQKSCDYHY